MPTEVRFNIVTNAYQSVWFPGMNYELSCSALFKPNNKNKRLDEDAL